MIKCSMCRCVKQNCEFVANDTMYKTCNKCRIYRKSYYYCNKVYKEHINDYKTLIYIQNCLNPFHDY